MTSKARPVDPVVADDSVGMSYLNRTPQTTAHGVPAASGSSCSFSSFRSTG